MEDFDNPNSVLDNSQSGVSKDDTNIDSTLNNITSEAQKWIEVDKLSFKDVQRHIFQSMKADQDIKCKSEAFKKEHFNRALTKQRSTQ
jgi:hypothetical protein